METVFKDWVVDECIGEGAFGKVYRMHREDFGYVYTSALKVIHIPLSQTEYDSVCNDLSNDQEVHDYFYGMVEDIVAEFALMSKLKGNSNIVSYEDHQIVENKDEFGWTIYIRMELLKPLFQYVREHPLSVADVVRLGIDISRALEMCKQYHIIHRDVKPENIFVSDMGTFKLGDFGIAKQLEKSTAGLSKKGTRGYMAPEMYNGQKYDASVDVYSLGVVLYRFLNNNRMPFMPPAPQPIRYSDQEEANRKMVSGEPFPMPVGADGALGHIVLRACAFKPANRYADAMGLRHALEDIQPKYENQTTPISEVVAAKADSAAAAAYGVGAGVVATVHDARGEGEAGGASSAVGASAAGASAAGVGGAGASVGAAAGASAAGASAAGAGDSGSGDEKKSGWGESKEEPPILGPVSENDVDPVEDGSVGGSSGTAADRLPASGPVSENDLDPVDESKTGGSVGAAVGGATVGAGMAAGATLGAGIGAGIGAGLNGAGSGGVSGGNGFGGAFGGNGLGWSTDVENKPKHKKDKKRRWGKKGSDEPSPEENVWVFNPEGDDIPLSGASGSDVSKGIPATGATWTSEPREPDAVAAKPEPKVDPAKAMPAFGPVWGSDEDDSKVGDAAKTAAAKPEPKIDPAKAMPAFGPVWGSDDDSKVGEAAKVEVAKPEPVVEAKPEPKVSEPVVEVKPEPKVSEPVKAAVVEKAVESVVKEEPVVETKPEPKIVEPVKASVVSEPVKAAKAEPVAEPVAKKESENKKEPVAGGPVKEPEAKKAAAAGTPVKKPEAGKEPVKKAAAPETSEKPKREPKAKILIAVLCVLLIGGPIVMAIGFFGAGSKEPELPQPTEAPTVVEATPEPTLEPTPEPTPEPTATPEPTPEPTPERYEVPELTGLSKSKAKKKLKALKLKMKTKKAYSSSVKKGHVIKQSVKAGKMVGPRTVVTVTISKGAKPKPVVRPNNGGGSGGHTTKPSNGGGSGGNNKKPDFDIGGL